MSETSTPIPPTTSKTDIFKSDKGFAETLLQDAFNPGVHPQSLDAANYVLIALFICSTAALVAWNYSIHFAVIIALGVGLAIMMNFHRDSILEASAEFLSQQKEKQLKETNDKLAAKADGDDNDDEDEDYEYIYVDEDDEVEQETQTQPIQRK